VSSLLHLGAFLGVCSRRIKKECFQAFEIYTLRMNETGAFFLSRTRVKGVDRLMPFHNERSGAGTQSFPCSSTIELSAQPSRSRLWRRQSSQRLRQSWAQRRQRDALSVGVRKENAQKVLLGSLSLAMSQLEKCVWGQGGPIRQPIKIICLGFKLFVFLKKIYMFINIIY